MKITYQILTGCFDQSILITPLEKGQGGGFLCRL